MSADPTWIDVGVYRLGDYTIVRQFRKGKTSWTVHDSTGAQVKRSATIPLACEWITTQERGVLSMLFVTREGSITFGGHNRHVEEGSVLLSPSEAMHFAMNVLPAYRDKMQESATTMRSQARAIELAPEPKRVPGTVDITPHPTGLRALADEFDRYVTTAQRQIAELQGGDV